MSRTRRLLALTFALTVLPATALAVQTDLWQKRYGKVTVTVTKVVGKAKVNATLSYQCLIDGNVNSFEVALAGRARNHRINLKTQQGGVSAQVKGTLKKTMTGEFALVDTDHGCSAEHAVSIKRKRVSGG